MSQVTDSGLKHLHSCSTLVSLNLLKCWALTPAGVGGGNQSRFPVFNVNDHLFQLMMILSGNSLPKFLGLLLALPRIHLLFFANMTAVMEEMSMDKEEESLGPFFLEHFDNSEYTMAVPGEGVRHTSFSSPLHCSAQRISKRFFEIPPN